MWSGWISQMPTGPFPTERDSNGVRSISPVLFTVASEIILISGRQIVRVRFIVRSATSGYTKLHDVNTLLQTEACTTRLLERVAELLNWPSMKIKPAKSCCLSIRKIVRRDIIFTVGGEEIPCLIDQLVRSLRRLYTTDLSNKHMAISITSQLSDGLKKIDQSMLPGKLKVCCYQFT